MAIDGYLKIDGIEGESQDDKHGKEIEVLSYSWGLTNSGTSASGGGAGAGKANHGDFSFTCMTGKHAPKLFGACHSGQHIPTAVFTARKSGGGADSGQEFLIINFTDILVSSYQFGGSAGGDNPVDSCSFNYSGIEFCYAPQKKDGTLDAMIKKKVDLKLNKMT